MHQHPPFEFRARRAFRRHRQWVAVIVVSVILIALSLLFCGFDEAAVLCVGIVIASALSLAVHALFVRRTQRALVLAVLAVYLIASIVLLTHFSAARDYVRWYILSGDYQARVLAQSAPTAGELRHVEWDVWGFLDRTTEFLVFDPTDTLSEATGANAPVAARGLPCAVVRVRRLASHWYAVLFYTTTYWGQDDCR